MNALKREIKSQMSAHKTKLGPARLCLDDIRDLLDAVKEFQGGRSKKENDSSGTEVANDPSENMSSVKLLAGNAVAESVEDLKEATPEELRHVSISSREPLMEIDLWHTSAEITVDTQDVAARAFADSVASFIGERKASPLIFAFRPIDWLFIPLMLSYGIFLYFFYRGDASVGLSAVGLLLAFVAIFAAGSRIYWARKLGSVKVDPVWRNEKRTLSSQARTNILIAVGAALLGAVITSIAGLWQGWFVK
ncbi:hypothetical protein GBF35_25660 [Nonomuraea phyllanthi]|uniref:hypothetical protein n=1 Tax=Nonomuraea phyllanthi TaxID=2219224 RepID=UPI00129371AF|nr:hypothetical protein [Nonomuraea phyllanthi]QFY09587.1 hypothetical protein GBF35_25660 [Nonomuraea phyllanthi]